MLPDFSATPGNHANPVYYNPVNYNPVCRNPVCYNPRASRSISTANQSAMPPLRSSKP